MWPICNDSPTIKSHFLNVENELNVDTILQKLWKIEELPDRKQYLKGEENSMKIVLKKTNE